MSKKYKSRKTYLYARRRSAFAKYRRAYLKREQMMKKRGLEMYSRILSYNEFVANIRALREEGYTNATARLLSEQQYKFSYKVSLAIKRTGTELGMEWAETTLTRIRTGQDVNLSEINEFLREIYPEWNSYQRRDWIREEFFGYAA